MEKKSSSFSEPKATSSKKLVRYNATCGDDDNSGLKPRLVSSQTKPALSNSVSKDSSTEFTDAFSTDLHQFIVQTLHKNPKDRNLILNVEKELVGLMNDGSRQSISFSPMSSYERMLVHRVSAYFGLEHNVSQDGSFVIASKSDVAKIPPVEFAALIKDDNFAEPAPTRSHSTLPRNRRRSQNYETLSCAMSALSFGNDGRNNCNNYSMRGNEQQIEAICANINQPYLWMPSATPFMFNPGMQNQNFGYYPNNQVNTSMSNYVPMPYPNMSPQPNQSYNYYGAFKVPPPSYPIRPDFNQPSSNVQTSP